jgi:hypothetical protein
MTGNGDSRSACCVRAAAIGLAPRRPTLPAHPAGGVATRPGRAARAAGLSAGIRADAGGIPTRADEDELAGVGHRELPAGWSGARFVLAIRAAGHRRRGWACAAAACAVPARFADRAGRGAIAAMARIGLEIDAGRLAVGARTGHPAICAVGATGALRRSADRGRRAPAKRDERGSERGERRAARPSLAQGAGEARETRGIYGAAPAEWSMLRRARTTVRPPAWLPRASLLATRRGAIRQTMQPDDADCRWRPAFGPCPGRRPLICDSCANRSSGRWRGRVWEAPCGGATMPAA